jgi:2-oxoglutarate ferredoxin oxidoreductase subunit alpha
VTAYREYPSLIKGGHATYQIDFAPIPVHGVSTKVDVVIVLNKQHTIWHFDEIKTGGMVIHDIDEPRINQEEYDTMIKNKVELIYLPALKITQEAGGTAVMANVAELGLLWNILKLPHDIMEEMIKETFKKKPAVIEPNINVFRAGASYIIKDWKDFGFSLHRSAAEGIILPAPNNQHIHTYFDLTPTGTYKDHLLINGNEALCLGAINAGVRAYFSYPMTPASSLLSFFAEKAHTTGMIVKQVEDEITAAGMAVGANFMGTRALTGTSGGGFDLMTEHVSFAGIAEIPFVCIIGQRPGPGTGLPTWTTQGDLFLAIHGGHGEFPRIVMSCSDPEDAFYLMGEAFNLTEHFQVPVLFLTDKMIAESLYTVPSYEIERVPIVRGFAEHIDENIHRYALTEDGISPLWAPGMSTQTYNANSDEHDEDGNTIEDAETARLMQEKRHLKLQHIEEALPEPEYFANNGKKPGVHFVGWGSTKGVMLDTLAWLEENDIQGSYLHYTYLWPLKTEALQVFLSNHPDAILIEGNYNGQLGQLIESALHFTFEEKCLKYDGRPFFIEELQAYINERLAS